MASGRQAMGDQALSPFLTAKIGFISITIITHDVPLEPSEASELSVLAIPPRNLLQIFTSGC